MKKSAILFFLILVCCFSFCACAQTEISDECRDYIHQAVSGHFENDVPGNSYSCVSEEIMLARQSGINTTAYAWVLHEIFTYDADGTELFSASYAPAAVTVKYENGKYSLVSYIEPEEGEEYKSDIRNIFPVSLWKSILEDSGESFAGALEEQCRLDAQNFYDELVMTGGLAAVTFEEFDRDAAEPFTPDEIKNIRRVEIHESFGDFAVTEEESCERIGELLSSAELLRGATNCPFGVKIYLFREDGKIGYVSHAQDGCDIYTAGKNYYKYSAGASSELWSMFGILPEKTEQTFSPDGQLVCQTDYIWYEVSSETTFEYDRDGNMTRRSLALPDGTVSSAIEYSYDENGFLSEEKTYLQENGTLVPAGTAVYTYDDHSNCIQCVRYNAKGKELRKFEYEYDDSGNLIRTTFDNGSYEVNKYDKDGNLTEISSYNKYGARRRRTEMKYSDGNLVKKICYDDYGEIESYELFEYDEDGNLTGTKTFAEEK